MGLDNDNVRILHGTKQKYEKDSLLLISLFRKKHILSASINHIKVLEKKTVDNLEKMNKILSKFVAKKQISTATFTKSITSYQQRVFKVTDRKALLVKKYD